jgi:hypothetical protein
LSQLKTQEKVFQLYGISLTLDDQSGTSDGKGRKKKQELFYPTACKTRQGLRIYGTRYLVDKEGKVRASDEEVKQLNYEMDKLGVKVKDCHTVYLTSDNSGA